MLSGSRESTSEKKKVLVIGTHGLELHTPTGPSQLLNFEIGSCQVVQAGCELSL